MMPPGGAGARADQFEALERIQHDRADRPGARRAARARWSRGSRRPTPTPTTPAWSRVAAPRPPQGDARADRARGGDRPAPRRAPSRRGWSAREAARLRPLPARSGARARAAPPLRRVLRRHRRVRAPVRRPARRLRARADRRRAARAVRAPAARSSSRSCRPPRRAARTARAILPGHFPVDRAAAAASARCSTAVGFEAEHWRLDASVHPFARSMAPHRRAADDALGGGRPGDGVLLLPARVRPRALRGADGPAPLPHDAGRGGRARRARVAEPAVGEPRRPLAAVLRVGAAAAAPHLGGPFDAIDADRALPRGQPGRLVAGPDRGRRDDLQPPHRAALRARARAGRGPARGRGPAGRLERGHAPAARPRGHDACSRASCRTSTGAPG